jgi:hypothetical protein
MDAFYYIFLGFIRFISISNYFYFICDLKCMITIYIYILFFFKLAGWDFGFCGHYWPIVPAPDYRWWWLWRNWWNEDWQGKAKYSEKTWLGATLSTTNPTRLDPGLNPGPRGGKPATNRLSYGAALFSCNLNVA